MLREHTCPICGVHYGLTTEFYEYRKRGGKDNGKPADWYCPNGHSLVIIESEADSLRRERDRLKQRLAQKDDTISNLRDQRNKADRTAAAHKGHVTRLKRRAKAGVCICCNRHFENLERHMSSKHADMNPSAPLKIISGDAP